MEGKQQPAHPSARLADTSRLVAGVAQHFNNLLTVILGNVSMVRGLMAPGDQFQEPLRAAEGAALRAADFVSQLLAATEQSFLRREAVNLSLVVTQVLHQQRSAGAAGVAWQARLADDLWPLSADPRHLSVVLEQLCANAQNALRDGGTVTVEADNVTIHPEGNGAAEPAAAPGDYVCVRVSDDGPGIPAAVRAHLFEPFMTDGAAGPGLGVGLAVARGLVAQHGGWIEVASSRGRGTTLTFYLPRAESD